jgi:hypothetical protein
MLEPYDDDLALRVEHVGADPMELAVMSFAVPTAPTEVWASEDGTVRVDAVGVHHEPVREAVAYRVATPDGVVVVSATRVCATRSRVSPRMPMCSCTRRAGPRASRPRSPAPCWRIS